MKILNFELKIDRPADVVKWYTCLPTGRHATMYFVYILKCHNGYSYKGLTDNLDRRLREHAQGKSPSTKKFLPVSLVHVEICNTRTEARLLEKFFKTGYGREVIEEIILNTRMW